jgi:hypothetical protein
METTLSLAVLRQMAEAGAATMAIPALRRLLAQMAVPVVAGRLTRQAVAATPLTHPLHKAITAEVLIKVPQILPQAAVAAQAQMEALERLRLAALEAMAQPRQYLGRL